MFDRPPSTDSRAGSKFLHGVSPTGRSSALYASNNALTTLNDLDDYLNVEELVSSNGTSACASGTTSRGENSPRKLSFSNSKSSSATLVPHDVCDRCSASANKLIAAVTSGHAECLRRLLTLRGIDPKTETTASGVTCVHVAAKKGDTEALRTLLAHDPGCVLYQDGRGATVAHVAAHSGSVDCLKELVSVHAELGDLRNFDGATPGHFAASEGHLDALKLVAQASATADSRTKGGATPVYFAAQEGHTDCVQWLVESAGADPRLPSNDGMTALHAAAQTGRLNTMHWLVRKAGCQLSARTTDGATPVHFAAAKGHVNILQWMLNHRLCNGLETDDYGDTPIHDAAEQGQLESLRVFAMHRCNMSPTDIDGSTPLDLALENGHRACADFLRSDTTPGGSDGTMNSIGSALSNLSDDTTGSSSNDSQSLDIDYVRPCLTLPEGATPYYPTAGAATKTMPIPAKKKSSKAMSLAKGIRRKLSRDHY